MNPYALFGEFLGLVFIVLVFGGGHVRRFLDILERRWAQKGQTSGFTDEAAKRIDALRDEIARLRDTSTQYDVSIQHTLDDLQRRVENLESRKGAGAMRPIMEAPEQEITMGNRTG